MKGISNRPTIPIDESITVDINNLVEHIARHKYSDLEEKIGDKKSYLTPSEIRQLLEYIKKYFLKNKLKMQIADMKNISVQISKLFPNENKVFLFYNVLFF